MDGRSRACDRMGRARDATKPVRSLGLRRFPLVDTRAFPPRSLRGGGQCCPQGRPIQSGPQHLLYAVGCAAREARAARRVQEWWGASFGITTCIPVQPAMFRRGLRAGACHLSKRGAPRHRAAGVTLQYVMFAQPESGECPLVAGTNPQTLGKPRSATLIYEYSPYATPCPRGDPSSGLTAKSKPPPAMCPPVSRNREPTPPAQAR